MPDIKERVSQLFKEKFEKEPQEIFSCGGRFEILGNHTDHNHGLCLAATCNLSITAAVSRRDDNIIHFESVGYSPFEINLDELDVKEEEKNSSPGLARGIAFYLKEHGYKYGGFNAISESTIFPGAGVSSSAAFELLVAEIYNYFYNHDRIEKMVLCKAGQYAENNYFGKKSGLLDQIGVGYGNIVAIDFEDIEKPVVEQVKFPFEHLHFVIVNTGGSHAELSDLYSAIPQDMYNAAKIMGHNFLREGTLEELEEKIHDMSVMEFKRALHFYQENKRVELALQAIREQDEETFLSCINESCVSSTNNLRNMMVGDKREGSPLEACELALKVMEGHGAAKINGGGFAGSIICVVPTGYLETFIAQMGDKYGTDNVKEVFVRKTGPIAE